jgi:vacuolar-type H+-ATPase subunit F/Vma7
MAAPVYLGDEVSAAGYRLAGALVRTPLAGEETAALAWARSQAIAGPPQDCLLPLGGADAAERRPWGCAEAPLVLVSSAVAAGIAEAVLRAALCALTPLVLVVPDLQGEVPLPDLAARLRGQLGLEA